MEHPCRNHSTYVCRNFLTSLQEAPSMPAGEAGTIHSRLAHPCTCIHAACYNWWDCAPYIRFQLQPKQQHATAAEHLIVPLVITTLPLPVQCAGAVLLLANTPCCKQLLHSHPCVRHTTAAHTAPASHFAVLFAGAAALIMIQHVQRLINTSKAAASCAPPHGCCSQHICRPHSWCMQAAMHS
jgi:hypothetical protein